MQERKACHEGWGFGILAKRRKIQAEFPRLQRTHASRDDSNLEEINVHFVHW